VLDYCDAPALEKTHGRSWKKLANTGSDEAWRKAWFYHYNYEKQFPYTPNVRAIRTDDWKFIHYPHGDGQPDRHLSELYDLKNDPSETRNLIKDTAQAERITELKAQLAELLAATGLTPATDKMPLDEGVKKELPDAKIR
jgi:N-acetylglucosamine-6-sulfatase